MILALLILSGLSGQWCWDAIPEAEEYEVWWSRDAGSWWDCQRLYVAPEVLCSDDTAPVPGPGEIIYVYVRATAASAYRRGPTPPGVKAC